MIKLKDEYTFAGVFQGEIIQFDIGDAGGGSSAGGWHPGKWEQLGEGAIAAINQYGEVFWAEGIEEDYQELVNRVSRFVRLWDNSIRLKRERVAESPRGGQELRRDFFCPAEKEGIREAIG
jgi:hypothetical protein